MRVAVNLEQCWHDVPGGTARTSIDVAEALAARNGIEVVGVAARHRHPPPEPWRPTVPVHHLPLPRAALYEAWHGVRRPRVERWTGPVDVLHVLGGAVAASRAPLVVTVHDLAFLHHPDMFTRHGLRFFERALAITRDEAAHVLVPSQATLDDCATAGIERSRLRHAPWGVDVAPVGEDEIERVRTRFGISGRYVLVVGTLEPRKNLRRLLDAWRLISEPDLTLVVVGPSGWGDALGSSGLPSDVTMTGFVERAARDALYAGATASVYPSLFEGFGLPVLESMALGCPVVTSSGTATEELVAGGAGVAVDPLDTAAIAGALTALLGDDDLRDRIRAAGLERARAYTWARNVDITIDTYRVVAA